MLKWSLLTASQLLGIPPPGCGALHYQSQTAGILFLRPSFPVAPG